MLILLAEEIEPMGHDLSPLPFSLNHLTHLISPTLSEDDEKLLLSQW